ncbi:MAG: hypothetical protein KJZ68_08715, partial [Phycisphaerales bacterium]|nr:hypothetical protein [Phycisphaerales bacterium]
MPRNFGPQAPGAALLFGETLMRQGHAMSGLNALLPIHQQGAAQHAEHHENDEDLGEHGIGPGGRIMSGVGHADDRSRRDVVGVLDH